MDEKRGSRGTQRECISNHHRPSPASQTAAGFPAEATGAVGEGESVRRAVTRIGVQAAGNCKDVIRFGQAERMQADLVIGGQNGDDADSLASLGAIDISKVCVPMYPNTR